jgi:hypothetical protein
LRAELELERVGQTSRAGEPFRKRLRELRAKVDPKWLTVFDEPALMRANPTPFPAAWWGIELGDYREEGGTYNRYEYRSIPPLPEAHLDPLIAWLVESPSTGNEDTSEGSVDLREYRANLRRRLNGIQASASKLGLTIPAEYVELAVDDNTQELIPSCTDCYFDLGAKLTPSPFGDGGFLLKFYIDSQSCLVWYLYLTPDRGHSIVVSGRDFDYDEDDLLLDEDDDLHPDEEDVEYLTDDPDSPPPGAEIEFCSPSFHAFVYRWWMENRLWLKVAVGPTFDFHDPRPLTPAEQAYLDHYRQPPPPPDSHG